MCAWSLTYCYGSSGLLVYIRRCPDRTIRGHLVVLHNPVGHLDVMEPLNRCGGGLSLPSVSGRRNFLSTSSLSQEGPVPTEGARSSASAMAFYKDKLSDLTAESLQEWRKDFDSSLADGCEVVVNAGFFNITSTACFGDVVSGGRVVQTSDKHNVNFGIRDGKFVVGHVEASEVLAADRGFDTLVSGLGWLVRGGEVYVQESFHPLYGQPPEDMSAQTAGDQFATLLSARTAIGHDKEGRLLVLQVEGETWVRGMSLYEFAEFAQEVGFVSAVNLDGGGSATMTVNHSLVSEPSWKCEQVKTMQNVTHKGDVGKANMDYSELHSRYCEKPVSSILCIHSMPPPPLTDGESGGSATPLSSSPPPSPQPTTHAQAHLRSLLPTPSPPPFSSPPPVHTAVLVSANATQHEACLPTNGSESFYRSLAAALGAALALSMALHVALCSWQRDKRSQQIQFQHSSTEEIQPHRVREMELSSGRGGADDHSMGQIPTYRRHDPGLAASASVPRVDLYDPSWQPQMGNGGLEGLSDSSDDDFHLPPPEVVKEEDEDEDPAETAELVPKSRQPRRAEQRFDSAELPLPAGKSLGSRKKKMTRDEEDFGVMTATDMRDSSRESGGSWFKKTRKGARKKDFEHE